MTLKESEVIVIEKSMTEKSEKTSKEEFLQKKEIQKEEIQKEEIQSSQKDLDKTLNSVLKTSENKLDLYAEDFCVNLHVYCTKNNVMFVCTDLRNNVFYKRTGGLEAKKGGTLKNSQKIALKNFEYVAEVIAETKAKFVQPYIDKGFGTKKHKGTANMAQKIIESYEPKGVHVEPVINNTPVNWSYLRIYCKRGRR